MSVTTAMENLLESSTYVHLAITQVGARVFRVCGKRHFEKKKNPYPLKVTATSFIHLKIVITHFLQKQFVQE